MAGKRPDQHNIAPGEAGATDYKTVPQVGKGKSAQNEMPTRDRQRLARSRSENEEGQPFLPDVPSPSAEANRAAHRRQVEGEEQSDLEQEDRES